MFKLKHRITTITLLYVWEVKNMVNNVFRKSLVFGIIVLFIETSLLHIIRRNIEELKNNVLSQINNATFLFSKLIY
jgi:hypothetical protein